MIKEKLAINLLVDKLNRKMTLVEMEKKILEISYGLLDDELYSTEDAVSELMQVVALIELEREVVMNDIALATNEVDGNVQ